MLVTPSPTPSIAENLAPSRPAAQRCRRISPRNRAAAVLLLALCGFLFFYGLSTGELYRTESLRAIVAAEFLRSGDWVVPRLYGEPFFTKPPGMYAAIALASAPAGQVREWSARLPSALAATVTVFLVYGYFRRQLGPRGGLVAAVVLPVSLMWLDKATAAEIDMLLTAWVAASILCFFRALEVAERSDATARLPRAHALWWAGALTCLAGGVLTKWTAPAFFYGTVVPLLWWRGRLRLLWGRHHIAAVALGAGLCGTWVLAAVSRGAGGALCEMVRREALVHLSPGHHHASYPWGAALLHPLRVWAASLPVSAFALPALWPGFARRWDARGRRLLQALHCWTWPNLALWSLMPGHGVRQTLPLYPAIAGLASMVWLGWLTGRLPWRLPRLSPNWAFAGLVILWLGAKLTYVHAVVPERDRNREARAKAALIAERVPEGKTLYLFRLKDEGIMFYYGRPVRRLPDPAHLPSSGEPLYCILDGSEWPFAHSTIPGTALLRLCDEQGDPIVLIRGQGSGSGKQEGRVEVPAPPLLPVPSCSPDP
jgi:4-amino-4-deoxy-L-arabinose transferase-like glycosyltransferase